MTIDSPDTFPEQYQAALRLHLSERTRNRPTSRAARALGRNAYDAGMDVLDIVRIHDLAMCSVSVEIPIRDIDPRQVSPGGVFLLELLTVLKKLLLAAQQTTAKADRIDERASAKASVCYKELFVESQQLQKQSQRLAHQILIAQEEERREISRDLHDEVAQILAGINVRLAILKEVGAINHQSLDANILKSQEMIEESVNLVHDFARRLRPVMLDDLGLIPALKSYIEGLAKHETMEIIFTPVEEVEQMDNLRRTVFYRVAQEALLNVISHAKAEYVSIQLTVVGNGIRLEVHDDGIGFLTKTKNNSDQYERLGILGMKERVEMVGGKFIIDSTLGKGTLLRADIPFLKSIDKDPK